MLFITTRTRRGASTIECSWVISPPRVPVLVQSDRRNGAKKDHEFSPEKVAFAQRPWGRLTTIFRFGNNHNSGRAGGWNRRRRRGGTGRGRRRDRIARTFLCMYLAATPTTTTAATRQTDSATARVTFTPEDPVSSESGWGTATRAYTPPSQASFSCSTRVGRGGESWHWARGFVQKQG